MQGEPTAEGRGRPSPAYTGELPPLVDVAGLLGRIARDLEAETTLDETLRTLVVAAVETIPGADAGGITEVHRRGQQVEVRHATEQFVSDLDTAQEDLGQGPCLDSAYRHRTVRVNDFETEERWPAFAARALAQDVRSMLSIQLYVQDDDLGALNLYSRESKAFDDESEQVGLLFATHAAIAIAGARREQQLRVAISSRDIIGQAKGILMERFKITADQAFMVMTKASSEANIKLRHLAENIAESGETPSA
jgi:GAF domain-containing protein